MVTYKSEVDWWIGILIYLIAPAVSAYAVFEAYQSSNTQALYTSLVGFILIVLVLVTLISPTNYSLTDEGLVIRHGLIRRQISYASISAVKPTLNPLSSPALSMKRLHVECDRRYPLLISPERREEFLSELNASSLLFLQSIDF